MDGTLHFLPTDTSYYRFSPEYSTQQSSDSRHSLSAAPSLRSQKSRGFSQEHNPLSQLTADNISTNTYSLLSDTSSISSYSSLSSGARTPLIERMGWSNPSLLHLTASQVTNSIT